jgi:hypothetical protein
MADYYYLDAGKNPVGPCPLERLKELHAAGTLNDSTHVAVAGGDSWIPYSQLMAGLANLPPTPQRSRLALASLICGCLSFLCGLLTGIPAVILGILCLVKKGPKHPQTQTFALTGLILGCCSLFFTAILAALAIPAVSAAQSKAVLLKEMNDARSLHVVLLTYANDHEGHYPQTLDELLAQDYLPDRKLLDLKDSPEPRWVYNPGLTTESPTEIILFKSSRELRSGSRRGMIFVSVGGRVDFSGNPDYKRY